VAKRVSDMKSMMGELKEYNERMMKAISELFVQLTMSSLERERPFLANPKRT